MIYLYRTFVIKKVEDLPKIVDHEEYRESLLDNCFELFARNGFQGATMREIAKELEISTGTLYHYFPNKESIFRNMMFQLSKKQVLILTERFARTKSVEERIEILFQYISANETFFQNALFLVIDYFRQNGSSDPENFIQDFTDYYRKSIGELIGLGDSTASSAILTFSIGLVMQTVLTTSKSDKDEQILLIKTMIQAFFDKLLKVA
jgi:AcrR family transcriptional regulator